MISENDITRKFEIMDDEWQRILLAMDRAALNGCEMGMSLQDTTTNSITLAMSMLPPRCAGLLLVAAVSGGRERTWAEALHVLLADKIAEGIKTYYMIENRNGAKP